MVIFLTIAAFSETTAQLLQNTTKLESAVVISALQSSFRVWIKSDILEVDLSKAEVKWLQVQLSHSEKDEVYYNPKLIIYIDTEDFLYAQLLNEYNDPDSDIAQKVSVLTESIERTQDVKVLRQYFSDPQVIKIIIDQFDIQYGWNLWIIVDPFHSRITINNHQLTVSLGFYQSK